MALIFWKSHTIFASAIDLYKKKKKNYLKPVDMLWIWYVMYLICWALVLHTIVITICKIWHQCIEALVKYTLQHKYLYFNVYI